MKALARLAALGCAAEAMLQVEEVSRAACRNSFALM